MNALPANQNIKPSGVPTSVYKYYDKFNILIYVGITSGGILRQRQHNDSKEWWSLVARQSVEHYPSRAVAHEKEVELIERFRPPFNRQHNRNFEAIRRYYLEMIGAGGPSQSKPPLERVIAGKEFQLTVADVNTKTRRVRLRTPYGDLDLAGLHFVRAKVPGVYDPQNAIHGLVEQIENLSACAELIVAVKGDSLLTNRIESLTGVLKTVQDPQGRPFAITVRKIIVVFAEATP